MKKTSLRIVWCNLHNLLTNASIKASYYLSDGTVIIRLFFQFESGKGSVDVSE